MLQPVPLPYEPPMQHLDLLGLEAERQRLLAKKQELEQLQQAAEQQQKH
jgi:hypothetical protein